MKLMIVALTAAALGGVAAYSFISRDSALVVACEEALTKHLKAPSTYKRLSVRATVKSVSAEDAAGQNPYPSNPDFVRLQEAKLEMYAAGAARHSVEIEYEAMNPMGVPLRMSSTCTIHRRLGAEPGNVRAWEIDVTP